MYRSESNKTRGKARVTRAKSEKKTSLTKLSKKRISLDQEAASGMFLHKSAGIIPKIKRRLDLEFQVTDSYRSTLPDMMMAENAIEGAPVAIQHVGISNFKVPLEISIAPKLSAPVSASVIGTVSLGAHLKGINMSRIMRSFYKFKDRKFDINSLGQILKSYQRDLESQSARIKLSFSFPLKVQSLRSKLEGFQYYDSSFEAFVSQQGELRRYVEFDFVYSSACPCSSELAEHAKEFRGIYAIPHSQRSRARLRVELKKGKTISLLSLRDKCLRALKTETQVMVKREDEQAFAELNGYYIKFVEDAARLLFKELDIDPAVRDFEVVCGHFESLHSHDAVSAICKGVVGGMKAEFSNFTSLVC